MPVVKQKPTSPARRGMVRVIATGLHKGRSVPSLTQPKRPSSEIMQAASPYDIVVATSATIALSICRKKTVSRRRSSVLSTTPIAAPTSPCCHADGERRYITPKGLAVGDPVASGEDVAIRTGNALPLKNIPVGTVVHCVELKPGKGAQLARSAGASVQYLGREGAYALMRLRSGETRRVLVECRATIGEVGNSENSLRKLGKAGAKRWRGIRPTVRGVAMNPVDHPHGGGEGRTSGGRHPVTPWGVPTKGYRTRSNKRTNSMIIRRRKK